MGIRVLYSPGLFQWEGMVTSFIDSSTIQTLCPFRVIPSDSENSDPSCKKKKLRADQKDRGFWWSETEKDWVRVCKLLDKQLLV